ncbi:AlpA family phage regulatory protein [Rhodanobacter sp. MP7CTX1]|uniref:helix-turn-helix transcriptional regulator n=1 Tax=Rhodanobacter sp. MP7CTX1 TaxID=2723084 RepID=UPI0016211187|nr:AlpA family phage regulatory protein [Rhodanobacter sp. MP7CTX1]MBB6189006.1 prophage regulatory protein [Rhodanobacter sp. MP7CTX1]
MENTIRLLRLRDVLARTGLSRSGLYEIASKEGALRPVKLGRRASAWIEQEVTQFIEERIRSSRENKAIPECVAKRDAKVVSR